MGGSFWTGPRRALAVTLASLIFWTGWELMRPHRHPFSDLSRGAYTDHLSHVNSARLLPRAGLDLWRKSIAALLRPLTREERKLLPADVKTAAWPRGEAYFVPGWNPDKPMIASWSFNPRFYPPGDALLFSPVALLYQETGLSFAGMTLLAILLCLLFAHAGLYVALRAQDGQPLAWLTILLFYFPIVHWSLEGFYDGAVAAPLVLCAWSLRERRGVESVLAFCAAAAIHFRAYLFAPWAVAAAVLILREKQWRTWGRRGWTLAAIAALLAFASLGTFALVRPALGGLNVSNMVLLANGLLPPLLCFLSAAAIAAFLQVRARAWMELALVAWTTCMLVSLRQAEQWHFMVLAAWLVAPVIAARDLPLAVQGRIWFVICAGVLVFRESLAPAWLAQTF
jgi:hypothetical protein